MDHKEILDLYKSGNFSVDEVRAELLKSKKSPVTFPLSEGQKGLWALQKMAPKSSAYNLPFCFRFRKKIDLEKLHAALLFVREQFPILKSVIQSKDGAPFHLIQKQQLLFLEHEDIASLSYSDAIDYVRKKSKIPFALDSGPLMRAQIFSFNEEEALFLITVHHLVFDGASMVTFFSTLFDAYHQLIRGKQPLPTSTTSYGEFVDWEQNMLASAEGKEHLTFWKKQLSGTLPVLNLQTDFLKSPSPSFEGKTYTRELLPEFGAHIKELAHSLNVNVSVLFLALFKILLYKYTGQDDIILGMPTLGRSEDGFESVVGYFINVVPLRSQGIGAETLASFINHVQASVTDALDHAAYPFPKLVKEMNIERTAALSPLFQAAFLYQNFLQFNSFSSFDCEWIEEIRQEGEFEFALEVYERGERFILNFLYDPHLFHTSTIERMMNHYLKLFEELFKDAHQPIERCSLLSAEEYNIVTEQWNATTSSSPFEQCIHDFFEVRAAQMADSIAIVFGEEQLTYKELDEKSTVLARYLQKRGVGPEILVGICLERSIEMVIGILGILKAGGAYVPLDPYFPQKQLLVLVEECNAPILLTQNKLKTIFKECKALEVIVLDQDLKKITEDILSHPPLKKEVKPHHLAYVIYTSGSTGKPKGVMVEHKSIVNTLCFLESQYPVLTHDVYLLKTNYIFDVSLSELFGWFFGRGHLAILPLGFEKSPQELMAYMAQNQVTHINFVPALLHVFLQAYESNLIASSSCLLKYIMVAGEAFPKELVKRAVKFFKRGQVENIYGPTETAIYATWFSCNEREIPGGHTPIGRPISNTQIYVLDPFLKPVGIGIPGELYIGGEGLARGYRNDPELSSKKFISNPFDPQKRLFKTGDAARWLPNGEIEYLGRLDHQVKIRGFRIELGAIDSKIGEHPAVCSSVTIVKQMNDHKKLITYYVAKDANPLSPEILRTYLQSHLPEYMVPAHLICIPGLPLTPNGKIDRKELENRTINIAKESKPLSPSEIEQQLLKIWSDCLHIEGIGLDDGFFDVGGDSLLAISVAEKIKKTFSYDFNVTDLFTYPTLRSICSHLAGQVKIKDAAPYGAPKKSSPELPEYYKDSVAIIGISCQFPKANNLSEFWKNLKDGKESVAFFTKDELQELGISKELIENPHYVPISASLKGKECFDPEFFHISPKDAEMMDPQLRLLLLHSWKAVEDAGYIAKNIPDTSVYMSASNNSYMTLLPKDDDEVLKNPNGYLAWVLAQSGTIPTMISHKLGFKGPSYFVHSNCSSSLVGLKSAFESLKSKESKYALVGATTLHVLSKTGYLHQPGLNFSSDGHIKAFDASADGMIPGEGVVAILLKNGADAIQDGDHIYALLRGIAVNNDGAEKAGFYAPGVKGQTAVIEQLFTSTGIPYESISYVEAHGTGTKLGDPIEIAALTAAYKTDKKQFCGIGSVKTNLGHLDTAAGLAGCLKVALSLYYGELVPSINYKSPNPHLNLENTPFYVVSENKILNRDTIHRATLSSFGIGGTNVHAVFEQPPNRSTVTQSISLPYLIPISAKNEERLREYVGDLIAFLNNTHIDESLLANLAYTFQIGRQPMLARVAFVVDSISQFKTQLEDFLKEKKEINGWFRGTADLTPRQLKIDEVRAMQVKELAACWSIGSEFDWEVLYPNVKPKRISLPTYPFAKKRYWPQIPIKESLNQQLFSKLHPMIHKNTSTLSELRFSSTFTGKEPFIAEHIIKGMAIVPAVVTLEMARAALEYAAPDSRGSSISVILKNVVWARPIVISQEPTHLHTTLFPEANGKIDFKMYSTREGEKPTLHNQGALEFRKTKLDLKLDLQALKAECNQKKLFSQPFYESLVGVAYGPSYQVVKELFLGQKQLVAHLLLESESAPDLSSCVLHPNLMDGALQVAEYLLNITRANLATDLGEPFQAALPFALEEMEVIKPCSSSMWVYVAYSKNTNRQVNTHLEKVDITLSDENGSVCVRIQGFSIRVMEDDVQKTSGLLLVVPEWMPKEVEMSEAIPDYKQHLVVFCECAKSDIPGAEIIHLDETPAPIEIRFQSYCKKLFEKIQHFLRFFPQSEILIQIVIPNQEESRLFRGFLGLLKTASLENSKLISQLIEVDREDRIPTTLLENQANVEDKHVRYIEGMRYVSVWKEVEPILESYPWKDGGIYLITGGAGGLGSLFVKEMASKAVNLTIILTGRKPLSKERESNFQSSGAKVIYKQLNVSDRQAVVSLIEAIRKEHGTLHGIIHAAGIIQDNYILNKTLLELEQVLAPKVQGLVNLDLATKEMPLDFMIYFSSVAGSLGGVGQADYAIANAFLNAYAGYRNDLIRRGLRAGRTLSINWPFWKEGGMRISQPTEAMLRNAGMIPMESQIGIKAFTQSWGLAIDHLLVLNGILPVLRRKLFQTQSPPAIKPEAAIGSLLEKIKMILRQTLSKQLKMKSGDIEDHIQMAQYGLDSIAMIEFVNNLNQQYSLELTPTIFFEYPTLQNFGSYLAENHQASFALHIPSSSSLAEERAPIPEELHMQRGSWTHLHSPDEQKLSYEPIAIVGMSGIFPMAHDLDEFWKKLEGGIDCISEIPADRWDWKEYDGDPIKEVNKTKVRWGGFIEGIAAFDPQFFGISPREAELMDPQQRLLLTYTWKALEDAGYSPRALSGSNTGLFIGTGNTGYSALISRRSQGIEGSAASNMSPSAGPNRVSYLFNFHGPSESVDTACSSSLVAMHHAIQALQDHSCEIVIAGGINTIILPEVYIAFDKAGALSREGRCKTFSDLADGFVHGEGAGILILKKLSSAEKDGDHIYGVIRGSSVNHGGYAVSPTTPNPKAQADLLVATYEKAGIDPRTISYIEAHGTGTVIGDPIEINGLKSAFQQLTSRFQGHDLLQNSCGLGSVKTNIGHLSLAAGVASVIKILLQMKHRTLVKSLHCEKVNSYIQLEGSPFYIVRGNQEWKTSQGIPRRAGVSSFGIGGVGAHVILEEYISREKKTIFAITSDQPALILLSAKNENRLKIQAELLLRAIQEKKYNPEDLASIAYTLQMGREPMEERLGLIVHSFEELKLKLQDFVEGKESPLIEGLYRGKIDREILHKLIGDEEIQEALSKWIERKKYHRLLDLWVKGLPIDWMRLYGLSRMQKIALPTYPFQSEKFWIDTDLKEGMTSHFELHPLIQQNSSDLYQSRFSSTFVGQEFFLKEHVVKGKPILPGVAHLEMAREALQRASGLAHVQAKIILNNVVWMRPIVFNGHPLKIDLRLSPEEHGSVYFEIYTELENDQTQVFSQGSASISESSDLQPPKLDLLSLQSQLKNEIAVGEVKAIYKTIGFEYGPSFSALEKIYSGDNFILASLVFSSNTLGEKSPYVLHPGILDSALQASSLLVGANENQLMLPFALEELEVYHKCEQRMWVYARLNEGMQGSDKIQKRDLDLCDASGQICVRMKGISFRVAETEIKEDSLLICEPRWKQKESIQTPPFQYFQHHVLFCEMEKRDLPQATVLSLDDRPKPIVLRFYSYSIKLFEKVQTILQNHPQEPVLIQVLIPNWGEGRILSGLVGLLKVASIESTKIIGQVIEVESEENIEAILQENKFQIQDQHIRYEKGKRTVLDWIELEPTQPRPIWKQEGVYLITGGLGGLGLLFASEIKKHAPQANVILAGRSPLSKKKQDLLLSLGEKITYKQADVSDQTSLFHLIQTTLKDYGQLNGIIHAAGMIQDNYILKKSSEEFESVLAPKVKGVCYIDEATKEVPLDFLALFSSGTAVLGGAGQADYATANAFMDAYCIYRNQLVEKGLRKGRTLSINWPLWKEGGMHVDPQTEKTLLQNIGLIPLSTPHGMEAFYQSFASEKGRMLVFSGQLQKMRQKLFQIPVAKIVSNIQKSPNISHLSDQLIQALKLEVSLILKLKIDEIDIGKEFNQYGFDSIMLTEFANRLSHKYKISLNPTIFFEYPTLQIFASYLAKEYGEICLPRSRDPSSLSTAEITLPSSIADHKRLSKTRAHFVKKEVPACDEPIAIVGISCVFPQAQNSEEFWKNLELERDCITEIPPDRWDWKEFYGDSTKEANKTQVKWGGFIDSVAEFDPLFFDISPREAILMDPQQRLLLTHVWKALEDAGYSSSAISNSNTGVFIGTGNTGYSSLFAKANEEIEGATAANMSPSIGPNRVNYFLNLHGPSEPIDTACSSSLVAIHHALSALQDGSCEMAITGGVNTVVAPEGHIAFDKAGALSKEGRCKTFSNCADGFAVGEGVGILILKKLSTAERDGAHIYGLIRGSSVNHGGRANSLTTPNPKAQSDLLIAAYKKAGIDIATVTYVETHGTGTEIGDPIEINGLKTAFKHLYENSGSHIREKTCGLGSVKSNIGHLSLAAGVASVIKVLLQMQHQMLVKSLHSETLNPYIQLEGSPFFIVQEKQVWNTIDGFPRRAGISSFGIGGVNAHLILEEYLPLQNKVDTAPSKLDPALILLSAKNEKQLRVRAEELLTAIQKNSYTEDALSNIAYTLQIGRDQMEERLALTVSSLEELSIKLEKFISGNYEEIYRGRADRGSLQTLIADEEIQEVIVKWIQRKKYHKLLDLWIKGAKIDWNLLYPDLKPKRLSLPTYPFEKERYWPEIHQKLHLSSSLSKPSVLHPFLHENISDLSEQKYRTCFTGQEFFFRDHLVNGNPVFPAVAYVEMAHAAALQAIRGLKEIQASICIQNIVWTQPLIPTSSATQITLTLVPQENGAMTYEITKETLEQKTIYNQGKIVIASLEEPPILDLEMLTHRCQLETLSSEKCYELFQKIGLHYGPSHRGIEEIRIGVQECLTKLVLPELISNTLDLFVLHPSMIDSALQSIIGLMLYKEQGELALPYALDEMTIYGKCESHMWAHVRVGNNEKIDIDLCNQEGRVSIQIRGLSSRKASKAPTTTPSTHFLVPVWKAVTIKNHSIFPSKEDPILFIGDNHIFTKEIKKVYPKAQGLYIQVEDSIEEIANKVKISGTLYHLIWQVSSKNADDIIKGQKRGAIQLFKIIKALILLGYENQEISLTIMTENTQDVSPKNGIDPTHASVYGLIGSLAKEYPYWKIRSADLDSPSDLPFNEIFTLPFDQKENLFAYRNREWFQQQLTPLYLPSKTDESLYRHQGVYVVIGGAGGLGEVWTEYVMRNYSAQVIWIGRRKLDSNIEQKMDRLSSLGWAPLYIEADATNIKSLQKAYETILHLYPQIDGVIHSAIILKDQSLKKMEEVDFKEVLAAKVDVSVCLHKVFGQQKLDFILFFSSIQSFVKAAGQSNYAAGCTFKDAFARFLSKNQKYQVKVINWGYWGSVGIVSGSHYQHKMAQAGVGSIEPHEGMEALEFLLSSPLPQLAMIKMVDSEMGDDVDEYVEIYPEELPSNIEKLEAYQLET